MKFANETARRDFASLHDAVAGDSITWMVPDERVPKHHLMKRVLLLDRLMNYEDQEDN